MAESIRIQVSQIRRLIDAGRGNQLYSQIDYLLGQLSSQPDVTSWQQNASSNLLDDPILTNNRGKSALTISQDIALLLRDASVSYPYVCDVLLVHLLDLVDPIPFLDQMPTIFLTANSLQIEQAIERLKQLSESDGSLLLPAISAATNLPLTPSSVPLLLEMSELAVAVVDEGDIPFLFRTVLKGLAVAKLDGVLSKIRKEVEVELVLVLHRV